MSNFYVSGHEVEECVAQQFTNFLGIPAVVCEEYDNRGVDIMIGNKFPFQHKSFVFNKDRHVGSTCNGADEHLAVGVRVSRKFKKRLLIPCMVSSAIMQHPVAEICQALSSQGIWMAPDVIEQIGKSVADEFITRYADLFDIYGCVDYRPHM